MAVVPAAADAVVLGARVDQEVVLLRLEGPRDAGEEARPAGARLVLHFRGEERQAAAGAGEHAGAFLLVERARAGALGAFLAQHAERVGGQALAPLVLRQLERLAKGGPRRAGRQGNVPEFLELLHAPYACQG